MQKDQLLGFAPDWNPSDTRRHEFIVAFEEVHARHLKFAIDFERHPLHGLLSAGQIAPAIAPWSIGKSRRDKFGQINREILPGSIGRRLLRLRRRCPSASQQHGQD